jgi:NMD protein affecting ribosome stability and mRNA decay
MAQRICCSCGKELTITAQYADASNTVVAKYCPMCIVAAYNIGYIDGAATATPKTDADVIMTGRIDLG